MSEQFEVFEKIARFNRDITITEKIDGTNAQVFVGEDGEVKAGSRQRWITPKDDNYGFARWVADNADDLRALGPGRHFGEWWGRGVQRNYSQPTKRFSLFNTARWRDERPSCCEVVPTLYEGPFSYSQIMASLASLRKDGSRAAPGFMKPEGIVIWHSAARVLFKITLEKDDAPKSVVAGSSNGRTADFGSANAGSSPAPVANLEAA